MLARAHALLCPEWQEPVGAGERRISAVRAPDGTLVYLVPSGLRGDTWKDDFHMLPSRDEPAGLSTVDHLVQALPAGRMDSFVLFWRALFGLQPQPQIETADPLGLVRSRALVSPNGAVRFALNASEGRGTATGRFISAFAGAGVHHIALATADIGPTAAALEALGAPVLPMPANYYDDLSARWGLDDDALAALQRHALLYDRDGGSEFWHVYTDAFQERFFFEAVQRKDGYAGFGAANAPVRAAAQARQHPGEAAFL